MKTLLIWIVISTLLTGCGKNNEAMTMTHAWMRMCESDTATVKTNVNQITLECVIKK